jgi:hypothetical protein
VTPAQRELARHALGLPNDRRRSYRNSFVAGANHPDLPDWSAMVGQGLATKRDGSALPFGGDHLFHLTPKGAAAALTLGESLDPEDFP